MPKQIKEFDFTGTFLVQEVTEDGGCFVNSKKGEIVVSMYIPPYRLPLNMERFDNMEAFEVKYKRIVDHHEQPQSR